MIVGGNKKMPTVELDLSVSIKRTPRVRQVESIFDVLPAKKSSFTKTCHVPFEEHPWQIGLIVGASGSGKSTVARELFGGRLVDQFEWASDKSLVESFPKGMKTAEITQLLSSVGFSSPPSWVRPFRCLSNGEQFRVSLARALAESDA